MNQNNTREALVKIARTKFAEHGYEGVSIASIADELDLTRQALLHHFGTKEKLYGTVLEEMAARLEEIFHAHLQAEASPRERFISIIRELFRHLMSHKDDARIIMRELLDNRSRADTKHKWYLKSFLETLTDLFQQLSQSKQISAAESFTRAYQIIGAINYFAISDPTLIRLFGQQHYDQVENNFISQIEKLLD